MDYFDLAGLTGVIGCHQCSSGTLNSICQSEFILILFIAQVGKYNLLQMALRSLRMQRPRLLGANLHDTIKTGCLAWSIVCQVSTCLSMCKKKKKPKLWQITVLLLNSPLTSDRNAHTSKHMKVNRLNIVFFCYISLSDLGTFAVAP